RGVFPGFRRHRVCARRSAGGRCHARAIHGHLYVPGQEMTASNYAKTLGAEIVDAGERRTVRMPYGEHLLGRIGFLHGGAIASLLSLACKAELAKVLTAGTTVKCVSANYEYVRGGREADATATATVVHRTSRTASVKAVAWQDSEDKPI